MRATPENMGAQPMNRLLTIYAPIALTVGIVSACGKGPDQAEFVNACVKTQATKPMCECAAKEAASSLSANYFGIMVADMDGRKQDVATMSEKMSFNDRADFAAKQFAIMGKCIPDK
jgi:hypothetical protein